jgi:hypothetical protein
VKKALLTQKTIFASLGIVVVAIVVFAFILSTPRLPKYVCGNKICEEDRGESEYVCPADCVKLPELSPSNFYLMGTSYLDSDLHNLYCQNRKEGKECPHTDTLDIKIKVMNIDAKYMHNIWNGLYHIFCKVYDSGRILEKPGIGEEDYLSLRGSEVGWLSIHLDYMFNHDLTICCRIKYSDVVASNEVCMSQKVAATCS